MEKLEFDRPLKSGPEKLFGDLKDFVRSPKFLVVISVILLAADGHLNSLEKEDSQKKHSSQKEQSTFSFAPERNLQSK